MPSAAHFGFAEQEGLLIVGQQSNQPPGLVGQQEPVNPSAAHLGCELHVSDDGLGLGGVGAGGLGGAGVGIGEGLQQPASWQSGKQALPFACFAQHAAQGWYVFGSVAQGLHAAHAPVSQMSHLGGCGGVGAGDGAQGVLPLVNHTSGATPLWLK